MLSSDPVTATKIDPIKTSDMISDVGELNDISPSWDFTEAVTLLCLLVIKPGVYSVCVGWWVVQYTCSVDQQHLIWSLPVLAGHIWLKKPTNPPFCGRIELYSLPD